jgi:hypothetical protein
VRWPEFVIWGLLFGLPLVIGVFDIPEVPKVIVAQILIVVLLVYTILKEKILVGGFKYWIVLLGVIVMQLFRGLGWDEVIGNGFRLQGVFLQTMLVTWAIVSSRYRKLPPKWLPRFSIMALLIAAMLVSFNPAGRAVGTLGEPNALAAVAVFHFAFLINSNDKWIGGLMMILILWFTKSRSGGAGWVAQLSLLKSKSLVWTLLIWVVAMSLPFAELNRTWENRLDVWYAAVMAGVQKPFFGWGFGNITKALQQSSQKYNLTTQYQFVDSSHNLFLDWWVQSGVVGLVIIGFIVVGAILYFKKQQDWVRLSALIGVTIALSFNPASVVTLIHFWWLIGQASPQLFHSPDHEPKIMHGS